jgi:hypothetical protein
MTKLFFLTFIFAGSIAHARPSTFTMTCENVKALVKAEGSIAMNYAYSKRSGFLYDRYNAKPSGCSSPEYPEVASVPTIDSDDCVIGFYCEDAD